jgi:hypothetical protein
MNGFNPVLAITSVPIQQWNGMYDLQKALQVGTIFPDLHKPFYLGGDESVG